MPVQRKEYIIETLRFHSELKELIEEKSKEGWVLFQVDLKSLNVIMERDVEPKSTVS